MDLHPTPFPGKRRPLANHTKKDGDRAKPSKNPAPPIIAAQIRPKRAFGVARSTNITVEKLPASKPKPSKPWKPSGTSVNPGRREAPAVSITDKAPGNVSGGSSGKTKANVKKNHHVSFQELVAVAADGTERSELEDGVHTPMCLMKPAVLGTPYHSAQNCSKCRVDRLEISSYWLSQIRIAEAVGKHFVSAAFFRLALECHAQPFPTLQSELKHYVARHGAVSTETLWGDVCREYGLADGQSNADPSNCDKTHADIFEEEGFESEYPAEADSEKIKDESLKCVVADSPRKDLVPQGPIEHVTDKSCPESKDLVGSQDDLGPKESVEEKMTPCFCEDSSPKHKTCGAEVNSHGGRKKCSTSSVSGKKSDEERSKRDYMLSVNDSNSNTKTHGCGGSAGKGGRKVLSQSRLRSKISDANVTKRNGDGARMSPRSEQSKGKEDEKGTVPNLSENLIADEAGEAAK